MIRVRQRQVQATGKSTFKTEVWTATGVFPTRRSQIAGIYSKLHPAGNSMNALEIRLVDYVNNDATRHSGNCRTPRRRRANLRRNAAEGRTARTENRHSRSHTRRDGHPGNG